MHETTTGPERPSPAAASPSAATIDATLMLTLTTPGNDVPTDASARRILDERCVRCHDTTSPARWNLAVMPETEQLVEIKRRIETAPSAPGHMPLGGGMSAAERTTLGRWIASRLGTNTNGSTRFAETAVEAVDQESGASFPVRSQGDGRYAISLGSRLAGKKIALRLTVVEATRAPLVILLQPITIPESGVAYTSIEVPDAPSQVRGESTSAQDPSRPVTDTPAPSGDAAATDDAGNRNAEPTPLAARLELQLVTEGSQAIADSAVTAILRSACHTCHNRDNPPRWDLTVLPQRAHWAEIARRINLDPRDAAYMPIGGTLDPQALATLSQWLVEQQNPADADQFAGLRVRSSFAGSSLDLPTSEPERGRVRIELGQQLPGAALRLQVAVTGLDGVVQQLELPLQLDGAATSTAQVTVAPRDTTAPTTLDGGIRVSNLGPTSLTIRVAPASDDRPASLLTYDAYYSRQSNLDSLDEIITHGTRIGQSITGDRDPVFDVSELEPAATYYFNIVVSDRTGNKTVYRKQQVLTLPPMLCEGITQSGSVQAWRDELARGLAQRSLAPAEVVNRVRSCFPEVVPQCVERTLSYAERGDVAPVGSDGDLTVLPQKRPPDEIRDATTGKYFIPEDIEAIARARGWPAVRYKSRHAGGFDMGTPNLLMVYVPGDRVSPPVSFDRWLNFPLPKDDDEPALGLPQHPRPKFGPPSHEDYALRNATLPRTFTMMSLDRGAAGERATVYFQKFNRSSGPWFTPESPENVASCVSCHPGGMRAISPLGYHVREGEERLADEDWKTVELINRKMAEVAGFKAPNWGTGRTAEGVEKPLYRADRGPIIGAAQPVNGLSRTREFIMGGTVNGQQLEGCYKRRRSITVRDIFGRRPGSFEPNHTFNLSESPVIDPDKVIRAMSCEGCHVNGQRWPLNESTSYNQVQFKILVDQSMPLGLHQNPLDAGNETGAVVDQLTPDERIALSNCLEAEFRLEQENLDKWLMQETCP